MEISHASQPHFIKIAFGRDVGKFIWKGDMGLPGIDGASLFKLLGPNV
jgi:hypothetical protein